MCGEEGKLLKDSFCITLASSESKETICINMMG